MSGVGLKSRIKVRIYTDVVSNAYCKIQVRTMKIPKIKSRIRLGVRTRFQIRNKFGETEQEKNITQVVALILLFKKWR